MGRLASALYSAVFASAIGVLLAGCGPTRPAEANPPKPAPIVLRGATVVDTRSGEVRTGMDVSLVNGRIQAVRPAGEGDAAGAVRVIDVRGKFIVPGYIDMHTHTLGEGDPAGGLSLMLANGVTGFRQMTGSPDLLKSHGRDLPIQRPAVLAMPGSILTPANAASPAMAAETVRDESGQGADFIKVGLTPVDAFFAAQAEAKRLGLPFVGHLPPGIDVRAAAEGGMKSIEHLGPGVGILAACSKDPTAVRQAIAAKPTVKGPPFRIPFAEKLMAAQIRKMIVNPLADTDTADAATLRLAISTFDEERCRELAKVFVARGVWQSPTLIRALTSATGDDPKWEQHPSMRYVAPDALKEWREASARLRALPAADRRTFRDLYSLQLRLTKLFDDAGVRILAGSDVTGAAWLVPGFALHQEFDELARAGLPPLRILQATTLNAAEFLGRSDLGVVEPGKQADLVILDADPTQSAANLHRIAGVVRGGFYFGPGEIGNLKSQVAAVRSVH
jgi:imidazolonepropionase-like amidohydrolase